MGPILLLGDSEVVRHYCLKSRYKQSRIKFWTLVLGLGRCECIKSRYKQSKIKFWTLVLYIHRLRILVPSLRSTRSSCLVPALPKISLQIAIGRSMHVML